MTASKTIRPDFLYPGGSPLMHPPLQLKDSEMYGFFVKGDLAKLQATVDSTLTACAGGEMRFQVFSPFVMLTFTKVHKAFSTWPSDQAKGWGEELDIITWVMVGQIKKGETGISRVFFYPCHIFVDDAMALINGRELFGYPKYLCEYSMPAPGEPARYFSLAAKGFEPFSPDSKLQTHPLIEVAATTNRHGVRKVGGFLELIEEAIELIAANLPATLEMDKEAWAQIAGMLRHPGCEQIFLKQFPDASGVKAVYQAIVAAPALVTAVHGVEVYEDDYEVTLHKFASFPLNETLGLQLGAQPGILPFHLSFDFEVTPGEEIHDNSQVAPQKIAILGGGVAAMTTAFWLTDQPGWQNEYDITVYQLGWRLGGKGASGRNAAIGERIEEHGLHIWFGFYQNAFKTIQKAYGELDRPPGAPLATWRDAFKPQHSFALSELIDDSWRQWLIDTPEMPGVPGSGDEDVSLWDIALTMYEWVKMWLGELDSKHGATTVTTTTVAVAEVEHDGWLESIATRIERTVETIVSDVHSVFDAALSFAQSLPGLDGQDSHDHALQASALKGVRAALKARYGARAEDDSVADDLRRLYICIDLAVTSLIGMLEDGVFVHGFDVINDEDLYAWLIRHGANEKISVYSAPIRGLYDLVFAYEDGDFDRPNIEAGTMLRGIFRMSCGYQGGIMWKMQAGMGDTVFTPFYEALKRRGVKFKFFHKVEELVPDATSNTVSEIRITQQVKLAGDDYIPTRPVKGLECWPNQPLYEQLDPAQAALLQSGKVNLESNWTDWPALYQKKFGKPLPTLTLKRGVDFDKVVFGISADGLAQLCPQLVARSTALQNSAKYVKTAATQAYQVWLNKTVPQLGWQDFGRDHEEPVLTAFSEPFDTWGPMDQTLIREAWPPQFEPKNVSYFCSALPITDYPPFSDHGFPARMAAQVKQAAIEQLKHHIHALWPAVSTVNDFDWSCLIDMSGGAGEKRFDSQYWRANVDPSERYVLSVVNSTQYRLAADGTGFSNFYVTGDWIKTGINAGCVEAAVMAGMQASRAICGYPEVIAGEKDV
ncbi:MAG TPA: acetoacetate decarboxylase family protein [Rhizobacter sp.]|nr:acetoacetate decarboxylase family protein [Rhizobacter sp.]